MNATTLQSLHPAYATVMGYGDVGERARYGERRRPNWALIALIAVLHLAALIAFVKLDVIAIGKAPRQPPIVVALIPLDSPPPPAAAAPPVEAPQVPQAAAVVVPPPAVTVPRPAAPVSVTTIAAPPAPVAAAAPAAPAVVAAPAAAPITPPSANAVTLHNPAPRYPIEARRKKQEGTVRLRVVITTDGRVKDIAVARSSGFELLDEAALDAVRRWAFVPGMQAGQPVEAVGFVPIPFRLT